MIAELGRFDESQQMNVARDWVEHLLKRVATAPALNGREDSKKSDKNLDFHC